MIVLGAGLLPALGFGFAAGCGLPFWMLSFLKKRRESEIPQRLSGCRRRHRSRHQGRPAVARQPQADRQRRRGAGAQRVPRHRRDADDRHADRRGLPEAVRKHPGARGELLRHRGLDPAARRRQSVGSARQPVAGAARPQEDEGEDPGDVDGSQGLRRRSSARCRSRS